jgi:hypothetical protein
MSTEVTALQQQGTSMVEQIKAMTVTDADTYARAGEMVKTISVYIKKVGEVLDPIVEAAHHAHKVAVKQRNDLIQPAEGAKRSLGQRMGTYDAEQARIRREAEEAARRDRERLEAEARTRAEVEQKRLQQEAETHRLEEAAALEAKGDTEAAVRLIEEPIPAPIVAPAPVFVPAPPPPPAPKVEGISHTVRWSAEITNVMELIQAVGAGKQPVTLVEPNMVALNTMARALKGAMKVPGVKAIETMSTAVRT